MRTLVAVVFASFLAPVGFPQEAQIMIVEKADSQKLAKAYREYKEAQKAWEAAKDSAAKTYTRENAAKVKDGWEHVQFSADFRAIVPQSSQYAYRSPGCWSGFTTLPMTSSLVGNASTGLVQVSSGSGGDAATIDGDLVVNGNLTVKERRHPQINER